MVAQESIFNLIGQHDHFSAAMRKKGTAMMPQHAAVFTAETGLDTAVNAPPSSDAYDESRPQTNYNQAPVMQFAGAHQRGGPQRGGQMGGRSEDDAAELARRRQHAEMKGGAMAAALAPELTYQQKMQRSLSMKNHTMDHKTKIKEQSIINGLMKSQGEVPQTRPAARKPEYSGARTAAGPHSFVEANKTRTLEHSSKAPTSTNALAKPVKYKQAERPMGQIPKYLVERKIEMEVTKAMAEDAERKKHAGPEVMPEEERLSTLKELENQKVLALKELNAIPISKHQLMGNQALIKKLDERLAEIDRAIILFSRKKVYIQ